MSEFESDKNNIRFHRLLEQLDLRFPVAEISRKTNYTKGNISNYINNKKPVSDNFLETFMNEFDLKDESAESTKGNVETVRRPNGSKISKENGVPYYDVDFYGGFDFTFNDQTVQPAFFIDYAPYNDCDAWINVSGKSMSPFISHGDIAALKKLSSWQDFIPFGEIYAILTEEHKTIKIVTEGKDENHLTLVPYNKSREFVEQQIPKKLIHQMYRVKGSIKKFF